MNSTNPENFSTDRTHEFVRLLAQHERRLSSYVVSLVANWADADDILQQTKLKLWSQFSEYDPGGDFGAWSRKIAFYQVLTYRKQSRRQHARFSERFLELVAEDAASMSEEVESRHQALAQCLDKITASARRLLWQCYADGQSITNAAIALGRSIRGTQRAVAKIRCDIQQCVERAIRRENRI